MKPVGEVSPLTPTLPIPARGEGDPARRRPREPAREDVSDPESPGPPSRGDPGRGSIIDDYV
jgi:hypothetical protein